MALTGLTKVQKIGISSATIPTFGGSRNTGVVTATTFVGDGSGLSNITGSGAGVIVRDGGSLVGTAGTINFGTNLNVSAISAGIVTVTNAVSASALTNLSDVTVTSASNGQILKHNGSVFVNVAETDTTYSQSSVASGSNVNLRLTDSGGTNDDILITAGSNITFSSVSAGGFTIAASGGGGGGGLSNVVEDTTPQLGGSLDLNNKFITGSGGINVSGVTTSTSFVGNITGNVTGNADTATTATTATNVTVSANNSTDETVYPIFVDGATGAQGAESDTGLSYNPSSGNLTATKFTGSGVALTGVVTSIVAGSNITLTGGPTGIVTIAAAGGGSGITDVIQDTTPQLGGNLDLNSKYITGSGGINVTGVITATTFVGNGDFVDLDVDGHTELDNVNIAGVTTFASNLTISGDGSNNTLITESGSGNLFIKADDAIFNNAAGSTFLGKFNSDGLTIPGDIVHSSDTNTKIGFPANDQFTVTTAGYARMEFVGDYIYINSQQTGNNRALMYNYPAGADYRGALGFYGTVSSSASDSRNITFNTNGNTQKLEINPDGLKVTGICSATSFKKESGTSSQFLKADGSVDSNTYLTSGSYIENVVEDTTPQLGGNLDLNSKDITGTGNAQIVGVITATSAVKTWTLGASGSSHYTFTGDGFTSATNDPDIYLERGKRYAFLNNSGGSHPFQIRVSNGGSAYSTGVTNNGASSGYITFNVPWDAPASLYYQCTAHSSMGGNIYITGGNGTYKITADANPIIELDRGSANNTNINLKYNGTLTGQMSVANEEFQLSTVGSNTDIAFYIQGTKKGYWKDTGELWFGSNNTYIKANQIRFGEAGAAYIDQYTTGQDINFRTSVSSALDTTGMTLKSSGNLAFASAKGIDYSAHTASNSTTSVLNDYKEGTWTPTVTDFNGTYSYQNGYYTKIGSLVHVDCIIIASGGTGTGSYLRIGTLPFTVTGASNYRAVGNIIGVTGVVTGGDQLQVQTNAGLNYVQVMRQQNNGAVVHLNRGSLNSGGWEFQMSITYRCNT